MCCIVTLYVTSLTEETTKLMINNITINNTKIIIIVKNEFYFAIINHNRSNY